jgi:hypothetical protein
MIKGKLWMYISIAVIAPLLLVTVGLVLGQAASPERRSTLSNTREWSAEETSEGTATVGDSMAPEATLDDGFWYQGRLTDGAGNPLGNANVVVGFRIYTSTLTTATALDVVTITIDTDGNGLFNEEIDFNNPTLFNGQALYLGLQVGGEASEMTPRQYLRPVPYALGIRPGAVIKGSITLGDLGASGYFYVHDIDDVRVLRFSGGTGYLTLGGAGEDGDLFITNTGPTTTFQIDGASGNVYVYDGVGATSANRVFEFDSNDVDGPSIWGDQTGNLSDLILKSSDDVNVYLEQTNPSGTIGYLYVRNNAGSAVWSVRENGNTWSAGTKAALVDTEEYGERMLYAMESPEVWFEDFGTAQLVNGQVTVTIEPLFLQTINAEVPYHVFVTPLGDCNGLYVTNKTATSFEVRELGGGTANIGFDYRIVAKRLGFEDLRLEPLDQPDTEVPGPGGRPNASVPKDESELPEGQK